MAFISNKERQKKVSKLTKSYWYKKLTIATTIVLNIILFALLIFAIFFPEVLPLFVVNESGDHILTVWGYVLGVLVIIIMLFNITSFVMIFTIKSPEKIFAASVDVLSKPLAGKKGKNSNSIKSRATL